MLEVVQELVGLSMCHDLPGDDMLKEFATDACETDGSVVRGLGFLAFFENSCDIGVSPVVWNYTSKERLVENVGQSRGQGWGKSFKHSRREIVRPLSLVWIQSKKEPFDSRDSEGNIINVGEGLRLGMATFQGGLLGEG